MAPVHSRLTSQGQISVPAKIRRKLGVGPGSILEWDDQGEQVVIRRAGRYTSEDVHRRLFPVTPKGKTLKELREGVRRHVRERHARG
jgi:antitoxin PrlF